MIRWIIGDLLALIALSGVLSTIFIWSLWAIGG